MKETAVSNYLSIIVLGLAVTMSSAGPAVAHSPFQEDAKTTAKVKAKIARIGVGEKARVRLKLRNGLKIRGDITSAGDDDFAFTDRETGKTTSVAYADVMEVKGPGRLSKGSKIAIAAGIGAGVAVGLIANHVINCFWGCR
jgi:hypothetical protein